MATPTSFTCFADLPFELRSQIWREALTIGAVWEPRPDWDDLDAPMVFATPAPHLAGLACREALVLMKRVYDRPLQVQVSRCAERGTWISCAERSTWMDLDHTIIAMGGRYDACNMEDIVDRFTPEEMSSFRRVAVEWQLHGWIYVFATCKSLGQTCPDLRTLIILGHESSTYPDGYCQRHQPLSRSAVDACITLLPLKEPQPGVATTAGRAQCEMILLPLFTTSPPVLHMITDYS